MAFVPRGGASIIHLEELFFEQKNPYSVLATDIATDPHIFAKWEINKAGISPIQNVRTITSQINSIMKRDSGVSTIRFGILVSDDDITYSPFISSTSNNAVDTIKDVGLNSGQIQTTREFIAIAALSNDGITTGTVKEFNAIMILILPKSYSLTRLV